MTRYWVIKFADGTYEHPGSAYLRRPIHVSYPQIAKRWTTSASAHTRKRQYQRAHRNAAFCTVVRITRRS